MIIKVENEHKVPWEAYDSLLQMTFFRKMFGVKLKVAGKLQATAKREYFSELL
jgi:hypothetical protein